eukprot:TRINITY_DN48177_c0_g1_i2.p1 TRINITY_DN48177_c0_g1~~TRINITY_DN48177_c0_g1_i2.p1  ORF type:complete len:352 (+),score=53.63 TRINITY_DN48177_c0_g1_i2:112-1056(+)
MELSILCDCQIFLVGFFSNQPFQYCSNDPRQLLQKYCCVAHMQHEKWTNTDYYTKFKGGAKAGADSGSDDDEPQMASGRGRGGRGYRGGRAQPAHTQQPMYPTTTTHTAYPQPPRQQPQQLHPQHAQATQLRTQAPPLAPPSPTIPVAYAPNVQQPPNIPSLSTTSTAPVGAPTPGSDTPSSSEPPGKKRRPNFPKLNVQPKASRPVHRAGEEPAGLLPDGGFNLPEPTPPRQHPSATTPTNTSLPPPPVDSSALTPPGGGIPGAVGTPLNHLGGGGWPFSPTTPTFGTVTTPGPLQTPNLQTPYTPTFGGGFL